MHNRRTAVATINATIDEQLSPLEPDDKAPVLDEVKRLLLVKEGLRDLVDGFSEALYEKLLKADSKYGHGDAWKQEDWRDDLLDNLNTHVEKGDPLDVAAYCAFAWYHKWSLRNEG